MNEQFQDDELSPLDIPQLSVDDLLSSLSLEVMRDNMIQQIHGALSPSQDFLDIVVSKFELIISNADQDTIRDIKYEIIDWCSVLLEEICKFYDLAFEPQQDESLWYLEALTTMYHFFVLNKQSNVKDFLINYIRINMKNIITALGIGGRSMDITTIANKRKDYQKDNVVILSNMDAIIDYIKAIPKFDINDFFNILGDDDFYNMNMQEYINSLTIMGEFVGKYIGTIVDDYSSDDSTQIRNTIRLAFSE